MSEVASAYVTLMPSAKGFGKRTESLINGDLDSAGQSGGKRFGSKMVSGLGTALKAGVAGVAVAAGGIAATGLVKGFSRLKGIEQAQAKLTGLGHDAQSVERIMKNATDAVTGTAFGLDSAATVAAQVVAAGVKPGKELESTLTLVGDAATIAGMGMDEMGSIFGKVAASGKIQGDVIAQLGDAGIPIVQMLSKELGTTAEETYKMASSGKVDFETFQKAMQAGLGGAAQESGKTFTGSLANMQAALGRLGARVLGGVFKQMPGLFQSAGNSLDKLAPYADKVGAALGTGLGAGVKAVGSLVNALKGLWAGGGSEAFGRLVEFAGQLQAQAMPIIQQLADLFMTQILPAVTTVGEYVFTSLLPIFQQVAGMVMTNLVPAVMAVAGFLVTTLYPAVLRIYQSIAANLKPVFDQLVATIQARVIPAVKTIFAKLQELWPTIKKIVSVVVAVVGAFIRFGVAILGKVLPPLIRFAGWLLSVLVPAVVTVIGWVVKIIGKFIDFGTSAVAAVKKVAKWVGDLPGKIKALFGAAKDWLKSAGSDVVNGLWNGIKGAWDGMIGRLKGLAGGIPGAVKKVLGIKSPSRVMRDQVGVWIPRGIAKGIEKGEKDALQAAKKMVEDVIKQVEKSIDGFKQIRDSVKQAFAGDLFGGTLVDFKVGVKQQLADVTAVLKALPKLQSMGAKGDFLTQLMSSGNTELILALAGGSAKELKAVQKDWNAIQSKSLKLGSKVAEADTGKTLRAQLAELKKLNASVKTLDKAIGKATSDAVKSSAKKGRKGKKK